MAVIKFGSVVTSGRGSLGGSTIQPDRSGHIWRNKPFPTKSRTQAQSVIRSINKTMQAGWRSLSDQDRKVWNDYATNKPVFNRSGEKHPLSGHSLWLKYQYGRLSVDLPFLSDPSGYQSAYFGPEIIKNGSFIDASYWNLGAAWTISSGKAHYDAVTSSPLIQVNNTVFNIKYRLRFVISAATGNARILFYNYGLTTPMFLSPYNSYIYLSNGSHSFDVIPAQNNSSFAFVGYISYSPFSLDNLSLQEYI